MENNNWKALFAEAIGTFVLVFFAVGVACVANSLFATAFTFGLVIVIMSLLIGKISGCHINPAVSLACFMTKRMSLRDFVGYVIAQIIGGLLGAICLFGILKMAGGDDYFFEIAGSNFTPGNDLDFLPILASMLLEIILTFVFVYVILHVTDEKNGVTKYAGLIIGAALLFVHLLGIGITGTSVNPARSIATAFGDLIFSGEATALKHVWIFIIAPMGGGALAAIVYNAINNKKAKNEPAVEEINSEHRIDKNDASVAEEK
ncbi:MAG: aquaporin [Bacilli bacterium]|nr:aquaporin [Bacilli bacterium]